MEATLLGHLETGGENLQQALDNYILQNVQVCQANVLDAATYQSLWKHITELISATTINSIKISALSSLRILSRNQENLKVNVTKEKIDMLIAAADLYSEPGNQGNHNRVVDYAVVSESQKCLSNMILNCSQVQNWCSDNDFIPGLMRRLKCFKDCEIPHHVRWFDIRLLFLITGVAVNTRTYLRHDCDALVTFVEFLQYLISFETEHKALSVESSDLCNEILKTVYNILHTLDRSNTNEDEQRHCRQLVCVLRSLLLSTVQAKDKTETLHSNVVNLLLLMPPNLYEQLLQPMPDVEGSAEAAAVEYDGTDMSAISSILNFIKIRLNNPGKSAMESVAPVLSLMIEMTLNNRMVRKFVRQRILPPLKDVTKRPEEGDDIRNKLCALMTSPIPQLKNSSADLLFILCKEKVERLIKYTGYGNAAGLLASRGLMLGGKGTSAEYSSDSEDSDTEEYERVKDQVNPVTGRLEPIHSSPFDGMTEDQKESEAIKLVNALDKLNRANVIQPCVIGSDGKPRPLNHVHELLDRSDTTPDPSQDSDE